MDNNPTPLNRDILSFLTYCQITKQYSDNTVRNYTNTLTRFEEYLLSQNIFETKLIDLDVINKYRLYLSKKESSRHTGLSLKAQAYQVIVLRSFFKFLIKKGDIVLSPEKLELPKTRSRRIEYLTEKEIAKLIESILKDTTTKDPVIRLRNQALILAMFGSGLRLSEVLGLTKSDATTEDGQLLIQGKGGKVRTTFLSPIAQEIIQKYLQARGWDENPYLFIAFSKNQQPGGKKSLTPRMVQMMIKSHAQYIGIYKNITPHTLRHSFATKILFSGGDIRSVQTLLGHSSISTTQIYTHITDWQIRELHQKVFGTRKLAKN